MNVREADELLRLAEQALKPGPIAASQRIILFPQIVELARQIKRVDTSSPAWQKLINGKKLFGTILSNIEYKITDWQLLAEERAHLMEAIKIMRNALEELE